MTPDDAWPFLKAKLLDNLRRRGFETAGGGLQPARFVSLPLLPRSYFLTLCTGHTSSAASRRDPQI